MKAITLVAMVAFGLGASCTQEGPMPDNPQPSITSSAMAGNPPAVQAQKSTKGPALASAGSFTLTPESDIALPPESPCKWGTAQVVDLATKELWCVSATEGCMSVGGGIAPQPVFILLDLGSEGTTLPESVEALCFRVDISPPCAALPVGAEGIELTMFAFEVKGSFTNGPPPLRVLKSLSGMSEGEEVGWGIGEEAAPYRYLYRIPVEITVPEGEKPLVIVEADMSATEAGDALKVTFAGYTIAFSGSERVTDEREFFSGPTITVVNQ